MTAVTALLTRGDIVGGASIHVRDVAVGLRERDIETSVLLGGEGPVAALLAASDVSYEVVPALNRAINPFHDARALHAIVRTLSTRRPDLLAAHTSKSGALGRIAGRLLGIPVIYTPHSWAFDVGNPPRQAWVHLQLERALARLPATLINVSDYERSLALRAGVGRPAQHVCIHNGIPDIPPRLLARPSHTTARLVMVARFEPQKDHETLLRALFLVRDLPWTAELVGAGPTLPDAVALVRELGMDGRVAFVGHSERVAERLAAAQLFVLSTHWESFPLSVLEAMRAALPVVATDVGGIREAIQHGSTGFLVPRGDPVALAAALVPLLRDPALRADIGTAARAAFVQRFAADAMLDRLEELYRSVIHGPTTRSTRRVDS